MQKKMHHCYVKYSPEIINMAVAKFIGMLTIDQIKNISTSLTVRIGSETWEHDNDSEFFADYTQDASYAYFRKSVKFEDFQLCLSFCDDCTEIPVAAPERHQIENIHQVFSYNKEKCYLPKERRKKKKQPLIFLGHGKSNQWRDLKDHLQDKHGYKIEAYEVGARAGHTIRDILEEMLTKSSIALLVMTAEDRDEHGTMHARENVIHELGLFQGKLGFPRAIVLLEEGTNEFSNIHGIQQIRYSANNIKETFGEVLATIKREFENQES